MNQKTIKTTQQLQKKYVKPTTRKHEPVKIVQGSGGCSLYYTTLYYY